MTKNFSAGRALVIGIGTGYPNGMKLPNVVRSDAEALAQVLVNPALCGYPIENVQILLDSEATRSNIVEGLKKLASTSHSDDTVLIFFSGHGAQEYFGKNAGTYICPVDFEWGSLEETGIRDDELTALVANIQAARVIVILDACHSEGAASLKSLDLSKSFSFGLRSSSLEKLASGTGKIIVASCRDDETSITYNLKGHSLFSFYLLEGLRGQALERNDGLIRVLDLFHYISENVPSAATKIKTGHQQHPVLKANAESNFPLALRKGGLFKSATENLSTPSKSIDLKLLERVIGQLYPTGPMHDEIWSRAGGEQSAITISGNGKANWHSAIRQLSVGGGGADISIQTLLETAFSDYSNNLDLIKLMN